MTKNITNLDKSIFCMFKTINFSVFVSFLSNVLLILMIFKLYKSYIGPLRKSVFSKH